MFPSFRRERESGERSAPLPSAPRERRIAIGDHDERVSVDALPPAVDADCEVELRARVGAGDEDDEPGVRHIASVSSIRSSRPHRAAAKKLAKIAIGTTMEERSSVVRRLPSSSPYSTSKRTRDGFTWMKGMNGKGVARP